MNHSLSYFTFNTTLTFLEGTHILDQDGPVVISGVSNLTLQGEGVMEDGFHRTIRQSSVFIRCRNSGSGFYVTDFHLVFIFRLTIADCGFRLSNDMKMDIASRYNVSRYNWEYAVSTNASFSVLLVNGMNAIIDNFSVQNGTGYGLTTVNVYGIEIESSSFSRNNNIDCNPQNIFTGQGGNIRFAYIDSTLCPGSVIDSSPVSMKDVTLSFGRNCGVYLVQDEKLRKIFEVASTGGGLAIMMNSLRCGKVEFEFRGLNVFDNIGDAGSNVFVLGFPTTMKFDGFNCSYGRGGYVGSGLTIFTSQSPSDDTHTELSITNGGFIGNERSSTVGTGIGTAFYLRTYSSKFYDEVTFKSCYFSDNVGVSIMTIIRDDNVNTPTLNVNLNDVVLYKNGVPNLVNELDFVGSVVLVNCECHASGLEVVNSYNTGIEILLTTLTFTGNNTIRNNNFANGGGMVLLGRSKLIFKPPTEVSFVNNYAREYGGAIYIPINVEKTYLGPCFYQIEGTSTADVTIRSINNSAGITGNFLSGGSLNFCYLVGNGSDSFVGGISYHYLLSLIAPAVDPNDNRFISSSPVGVVFCRNNSYSANERTVHAPYTYIPGKSFNISITTVSELGSIAPGMAHIGICNCTIRSCCTPDVYLTITTINMCFDVPVVLPGNNYTESMMLILTTENIVSYQASSPLIILVDSAGCPPGFIAEGACVCNEFAHKIGAFCNINTTTITTPGGVWISYDSTSNCTLYSDSCPNGHCVEGTVTFNIIDSPDLQCANHRSGVLCGECADGYSLLLGSNECGLCPNDNYLSLLLVFGVAGIALVVLLIALNLTVSVGTINGLIFYANIVKINEDILFLNDSSKPVVLRQFISFINLDYGLKTCFYNGLSSYVKAWLQFAFPLYIWLIMIAIMLLSRRFTKVSKLIGNNAVKVLATLLLLSYTKLIRAIGVALGSETVYCDDEEQLVWSFDSNISFFGVSHTLLLVFSLLILVCLIVPYSLLLISLPFVDRFFTLIRCNFLWLKPFTDAYAGPFKQAHQFWPGLLITARILLTVVNQTTDKDTAHFMSIFCVITLLTIGYNIQGPYQKNYLNILESWFLADLLALSVLGLKNVKLSTEVKIGSSISIGLALITFVVILIFHMRWLYWKKALAVLNRSPKIAQWTAKILNSNSTTTKGSRSSDVELETNVDDNAVFKKANYSKYRDSILEEYETISL